MHTFEALKYFLIATSVVVASPSRNDNSLRKALDDVGYRERQLASIPYYVPASKGIDRPLQPEDELMYLEDKPLQFDDEQRYPPYGYQKSYGLRAPDEEEPFSDVEDYKNRGKYLKERLLEKLALDYLQDVADTDYDHHAKRSYFRERELSTPPEILQSLYAEEENEPPSPFRERAKSRSRSLLQSYKPRKSDVDNGAMLNSLWRKYKNENPEEMTDSDILGFIKYLGERDETGSDNFVPDDEDGIIFLPKEPQDVRSKRFWRGTDEKIPYNSFVPDREINIKKRSPEQPKKSPKKFKVGKNSTTEVKQPKNDTSGLNEHGFKNVTVPVTTERATPETGSSVVPLKVLKRSVDWSKYFGVDKRSKRSYKTGVMLDPGVNLYDARRFDVTPYEDQEFNEFYENSANLEKPDDIKDAEDAIIDNVLKYTGAHQGIKDPEELERFRSYIVDQLGTAYKLEKMRKDMVDKSQMEPPIKYFPHQYNEGNVKKEDESMVKGLKDDRNVSNVQHEHFSNEVHKHEATGFVREEPEQKGCPRLNNIVDHCHEVMNLATGNRYDRALVPHCAVRQVCVICDGRMRGMELARSCDEAFESHAVGICGEAPLCQYAARRMLYMLRGYDKNFKEYRCEKCLENLLAIV